MSVQRTIVVTLNIEGDADTIADLIADKIRRRWEYRDMKGDGETKTVEAKWFS